MSDDDYFQKLEEAKRGSTLQVLFKCARLLNEMGVARAFEKFPDSPPLRAAHTSLLAHIDIDGTRLTEIARRAGVSKQAVGQLVSALEAADVLERRPDPSDGRAQLISFSDEGRQRIFAGLQVLGELEAELAEAIGAQRMRGLREGLLAVHDLLEENQLPR